MLSEKNQFPYFLDNILSRSHQLLLDLDEKRKFTRDTDLLLVYFSRLQERIKGALSLLSSLGESWKSN